MGAYTAIYDACVLHSAPLRDLLVSLAGTGLFRARWTEDIHKEWMASVAKRGFDPEKLKRTRDLLDQSVPDCLITGYEPLINTLSLPDPNDRHVLAAAIVGGADVIVTSNLKHFPEDAVKPYHIEAQHPDDFVVCVIDLSPGRACAAIKTHRERLRNPPKNIDEYLTTLASQQLPQTVAKLSEFRGLI